MQQSFAYRCWLFGVGAFGGGMLAHAFPVASFLAVPILFGWFAGGGMTAGPFVFVREAAVLCLGTAIGTTFVLALTLGWHRDGHREWILYSPVVMTALFWVFYAGMRWIHDTSARSVTER